MALRSSVWFLCNLRGSFQENGSFHSHGGTSIAGWFINVYNPLVLVYLPTKLGDFVRANVAGISTYKTGWFCSGKCWQIFHTWSIWVMEHPSYKWILENLHIYRTAWRTTSEIVKLRLTALGLPLSNWISHKQLAKNLEEMIQWCWKASVHYLGVGPAIILGGFWECHHDIVYVANDC